MNIDKAIRKQRKSYKRFMLSMGFIFFVLPAILIVSKRFGAFYIAYLVMNEMVVLLAAISRANSDMIEFEHDSYKMRVRQGLFKYVTFICDKIAYVHTEACGEDDFKIYLLATSKFRSRYFYPVNLNFLKKHPYIAHHYNKLKKSQPENSYFFTVISRGGYGKYEFLDKLYTSCVYAGYSEDAVERIKRYRQDKISSKNNKNK